MTLDLVGFQHTAHSSNCLVGTHVVVMIQRSHIQPNHHPPIQNAIQTFENLHDHPLLCKTHQSWTGCWVSRSWWCWSGRQPPPSYFSPRSRTIGDGGWCWCLDSELSRTHFPLSVKVKAIFPYLSKWKQFSLICQSECNFFLICQWKWKPTILGVISKSWCSTLNKIGFIGAGVSSWFA